MKIVVLCLYDGKPGVCVMFVDFKKAFDTDYSVFMVTTILTIMFLSIFNNLYLIFLISLFYFF